MWILNNFISLNRCASYHINQNDMKTDNCVLLDISRFIIIDHPVS